MFRIPGKIGPEQKHNTNLPGTLKTITDKKQYNYLTHQKEELTGTHILQTLIELLGRAKDHQEFQKECNHIIHLLQKDCDVIIQNVMKGKAYPLYHTMKRFHMMKFLRQIVYSRAMKTAPYSREEKEIRILTEKLSILHTDLRQLRVITLNIQEEKRLKKIMKKDSIPHVHHRNELFQLLQKRSKRIVNHIPHYAPHTQPHESIQEQLISEDIETYNKVYHYLVATQLRHHDRPADEEKRLLRQSFHFTQEVRFMLYYVLGQLPEDIPFENEKKSLEKPSLVVNDLYKCPITGLLGKKNDFDVHHVRKQSHIYGSMKENITYILKDFHSFYHLITNHTELEHPLIRIKNILSFLQGVSVEEFQKPSSPLLKLSKLIEEKMRTIASKTSSKLRQLVHIEWKLATCIDRIRALPNPNQLKSNELLLSLQKSIDTLHVHIHKQLEKYGCQLPKNMQENEHSLSILKEYIFHKNSEHKISQKDILKGILSLYENTQKKHKMGFSEEHPQLCEEEEGWYIISVYKIFCDIIRTTLYESPYLLEKKVLRTLDTQVSHFQDTFIELLKTFHGIPQAKVERGFRSKLAASLQSEKELYEFIIHQLFLDRKQLDKMEREDLIPETLKPFFKQEKEYIPYFMQKYRELLLINGIPHTLLHNISLAHGNKLKKENGAVKLQSLHVDQSEQSKKF